MKLPNDTNKAQNLYQPQKVYDDFILACEKRTISQYKLEWRIDSNRPFLAVYDTILNGANPFKAWYEAEKFSLAAIAKECFTSNKEIRHVCADVNSASKSFVSKFCKALDLHPVDLVVIDDPVPESILDLLLKSYSIPSILDTLDRDRRSRVRSVIIEACNPYYSLEALEEELDDLYGLNRAENQEAITFIKTLIVNDGNPSFCHGSGHELAANIIASFDEALKKNKMLQDNNSALLQVHELELDEIGVELYGDSWQTYKQVTYSVFLEYGSKFMNDFIRNDLPNSDGDIAQFKVEKLINEYKDYLHAKSQLYPNELICQTENIRLNRDNFIEFWGKIKRTVQKYDNRQQVIAETGERFAKSYGDEKHELYCKNLDVDKNAIITNKYNLKFYPKSI